MSYNDAGIVLPPKRIIDYNITLTHNEKEIYQYFNEETRQIFNSHQIGGIKTFADVLAKLCRLRQICVAPYLITAESKRGYRGEADEEVTAYQEELTEKFDVLYNGLASWVKTEKRNGRTWF